MESGLNDLSRMFLHYSNPQKCHHSNSLDGSGITKAEVSDNVAQRGKGAAGKSIREASGRKRYSRSIIDQCERGVATGQTEGSNGFGRTTG